MKTTYKVHEVVDATTTGNSKKSSYVRVQLRDNDNNRFPGSMTLTMSKSDRVCVGDEFTITITAGKVT